MEGMHGTLSSSPLLCHFVAVSPPHVAPRTPPRGSLPHPTRFSAPVRYWFWRAGVGDAFEFTWVRGGGRAGGVEQSTRPARAAFLGEGEARHPHFREWRTLAGRHV